MHPVIIWENQGEGGSGGIVAVEGHGSAADQINQDGVVVVVCGVNGRLRVALVSEQGVLLI